MEKFSDFFEDLTPSKGSWEINQEEFVEEDFHQLEFHHNNF